MRIQIISDLHMEFGAELLNFTDTDLIIMAGDVHLGTKGVEWMRTLNKDIPIIYVLGNHEYYKGNYPKTLHKIQEAAQGTHIHVLENESVIIGDITFHGATLWTNFELLGEARTYGMICQEKMNDYKKITYGASYSRLRSIDTFKIHNRSLNWLKDSLSQSLTHKNIVITHHAPSPKSLPEIFAKDSVSAAYASDLEPLIETYKPAYWIHGHIHTPCRYIIGQTEIICNPHGYIDQPDNGFERKMTIEI
ncbi:3',5'-cyclic adenosine monophosphate phosphodiesterase CpdA [compost metagenome]